MNHTPDNHTHHTATTDYTTGLRQADLAAALALDHAAVAEALEASEDAREHAATTAPEAGRVAPVSQLTRAFGVRVPMTLILLLGSAQGHMPWQAALAVVVVSELAVAGGSVARRSTRKENPA
ncbi:hypothetical protein D7D52_17060 [Nocardia yunnanensis]|uniref:Uncharacterized protein n=1 Tax=Nocardia yunnanensis TaxID=2382165 RepID=A0A386ZFM5_9NOCA|nr:hypothetical protein [Nocardia yunnanensis]AYF75299.1 hypothetical protein D7D52_17060 [Nocardia yunnanensis]